MEATRGRWPWVLLLLEEDVTRVSLVTSARGEYSKLKA